MATDLAEFLGAAIGFHLLLGIEPLPRRRCSPAIAAFAILGLQRFGFRPFEAVIAAIVGVIGVCYLAEIFFAQPDARRRSPSTRSCPEFQGSRVGAARGRDPRRDRDAARDLPPLGADPGPDRPRDDAEARDGCCATRAST